MSIAIAADGTELFWMEQGAGDTIIFIAGQAMSHQGWLDILPTFTPQFRTIVFDHRGIGDSGTTSVTPYSTDLFSDDVVSILHAAGVSRAHVYGHSMGGRIAQQLALNHPEVVDRLILGATTAGESHGIKRSREATRDLYSGDWRRLAPHFFSAAFIAQHPERVKQFFWTNASPETLRGHFAASTKHDAWDRLDQIQSPTLIVHGDNDDLTPIGNATLMAERIPNVELAIVEGGFHGYFLERQDANDRVLQFLT